MSGLAIAPSRHQSDAIEAGRRATAAARSRLGYPTPPGTDCRRCRWPDVVTPGALVCPPVTRSWSRTPVSWSSWRACGAARCGRPLSRLLMLRRCLPGSPGWRHSAARRRPPFATLGARPVAEHAPTEIHNLKTLDIETPERGRRHRGDGPSPYARRHAYAHVPQTPRDRRSPTLGLA